jgi:hypothetical protein
MRKITLGLVVFVLFACSCSSGKEISPEQRQREIDQSKKASQAYAAAVKRAEADDPAGFLKLYEIATDDMTYTVEYSEVAQEKLYLLLYSKTALWIKTFSKVDLEKFNAFVKGIEVSQLPAGVASDEQFKETILSKLEKMKGDKKEMELIDHILGLYNRKRQ